MEMVINKIKKYLKEWDELRANMPTDPIDHGAWREFHEEEKSLHGLILKLYEQAADLKGLLTAEEQKALENVLTSVV